jgi:hypothetical protein
MKLERIEEMINAPGYPCRDPSPMTEVMYQTWKPIVKGWTWRVVQTRKIRSLPMVRDFGERPVGVVPSIFMIVWTTVGSPRRLEAPSSSSCMTKEEDHAIGRFH